MGTSHPICHMECTEEANKGVKSLPQDLLMDILLRLPVRVLCQFRCVSKQWRDLICDPLFKRWHRYRSQRKHKILLSHHDKTKCDTTLLEQETNCGPTSKSTLYLSSIDITNGNTVGHGFPVNVYDDIPYYTFGFGCDLICFANDQLLHICNPTTQEFVKLPMASFTYTVLKTIAGLGYVPSTNEYKIVVPTKKNDLSFLLLILTLKDGGPNNIGSWREIIDLPQMALMRGPSVYVEGAAICWLIFEKNNDIYERRILWLDLENEEFKSICCPPCYLGLNFESEEPIIRARLADHLVELKGCLCLVNFLRDIRIMNIWMLKDHDNHSWAMEYSIDLYSVCTFPVLLDLIHFNNDSEELLVWTYGRTPFFYNIESKTFRRADELNVDGLTFESLYFESLFSLGYR